MVRPRFITAHILHSTFNALQGVGELVDVVFGVLPDEFVLGLDEVEVISAAQGGCLDEVDGVLLTDLGGADALFGQALDSVGLAISGEFALMDEVHPDIAPRVADGIYVFITVFFPDDGKVRSHVAYHPDKACVRFGLGDDGNVDHDIGQIELKDIGLVCHGLEQAVVFHGGVIPVIQRGDAEVVAKSVGVKGCECGFHFEVPFLCTRLLHLFRFRHCTVP